MKTVGKYELVRRLARGGMAELHLARSRGPHGFEKIVVLKRIHPHLADDPGFVAMFLDEARLAAQLDHPNVVQVFDIVESEDGVFYAMEYLRGVDLRQLLTRVSQDGSSIPMRHAVSIAICAASGLHHAHCRIGLDDKPLRVIHRDVSPTNVLVTYEGAVKLVDFGIAKAASNEHSTHHSGRKGKVRYMSPEQCAGSPLDARSDVFALGAVLYELTTGRRPFAGDSEFAIMNEIVNRPVTDPREVDAEYPDELAAIVLKALQRDADDRYSTAERMRQDLEAFARGQAWSLSAGELGDYLRGVVPDRETPSESNGPTEVAPEALLGDRTPPTRRVETADKRGSSLRMTALVAVGVAATSAIALVAAVDDDPEPAPAAVEVAAPTPDPVPTPLDVVEPSAVDEPIEQPAPVPESEPEPEKLQDVQRPPKRAKKPRRPKKPPAAKAVEPPESVDSDQWVPIRRKAK